MKWVTRKYRRQLRREAMRQWHQWFAWRPVHVEEQKYDGVVVPGMRVWLEPVERRRPSREDFIRDAIKEVKAINVWQYRTPQGAP